MDENNKNGWRVSRAIIYVKNDYPETPLVTVPEIHRKYNLGIAAETIEAVDFKASLNKKKIRIYELGKDTMFTPEMREPDEHPFIIIKDHGDSTAGCRTLVQINI